MQMTRVFKRCVSSLVPLSVLAWKSKEKGLPSMLGQGCRDQDDADMLCAGAPEHFEQR